MTVPQSPSGYNLVQLPKYSPQQMERSQARLGQLGESAGRGTDLLSKLALGDDSSYNDLAAPALRDFRERALPEIAQRFQGTGGLNSSSFANAATSAGTDLTERLSAQRAIIQDRSLSNLLNLEQSLLQNSPYDHYYQPNQNKRSLWESLRGPLVGAAGGALTGFGMGGPWGAAIGGTLGGLSGGSANGGGLPNLSFLRPSEEGNNNNNGNQRNQPQY